MVPQAVPNKFVEEFIDPFIGSENGGESGDKTTLTALGLVNKNFDASQESTQISEARFCDPGLPYVELL